MTYMPMVMLIVMAYLGIDHGILVYVIMYKSEEVEGIEIGSLLVCNMLDGYLLVDPLLMYLCNIEFRLTS